MRHNIPICTGGCCCMSSGLSRLYKFNVKYIFQRLNTITFTTFYKTAIWTLWLQYFLTQILFFLLSLLITAYLFYSDYVYEISYNLFNALDSLVPLFTFMVYSCWMKLGYILERYFTFALFAHLSRLVRTRLTRRQTNRFRRE